MFTVSDLLIISKTDALGLFDFDPSAAAARAKALNPAIEVIETSAKTGEGFDAVADWIRAASGRVA
jgi:hydrogenase nickel incorporation protein HypB